MNTKFYAYVQARPDHSIFYVGKGCGTRAYIFSPRNSYHGNVVKKHGVENILVGRLECSSEEIAFDLEKGLIKCLRRAGVKLTNMCDGGGGNSGWSPSEATTKAFSRRQKVLWADQKYRDSLVSKLKKFYSSSEGREKQKERSNKMWSDPVLRKHTLSKIVLITSEKAKELWSDPLIYEKRILAANSVETREKRSSSIKQSWKDEEKKEARIKSMKEAWVIRKLKSKGLR